MNDILHMKRYSKYARLLLVFCKLLRRVVELEDPLYKFCRSSIREIVEAIRVARCKKNIANEFFALNDAFMFVCEFEVDDLSTKLESSNEFTGLSLMSNGCDFT